jgi:MFS family permease
LEQGRRWSRDRIVAAAVVVGAATCALTAAVTGLSHPITYAAFGAVVAFLASRAIAPSMLSGRSLSTTALALAIYALGVLMFPFASLLLGIEYPGGSALRHVSEIPPSYVLAPLGVLFAVPFVPATLLTAMAAWRFVPDAPLTQEDPDQWAAADRRFVRGTIVGLVALVVVGVGGYVLLGSVVEGIGS